MLSRALVPSDGKEKMGPGLPLSQLTLARKSGGQSDVVVMWDTGCSPSALVTLDKVRQWTREGTGISVTHFQQPKSINGVGADPVLLVGTVELPFSWSGRPVYVQAVVMSNGSTGCSDVLVGNYHMRHDWNYLMDKEFFILQSPPDGGSALSVPIDWRLGRNTSASAAMMVGDAGSFSLY